MIFYFFFFLRTMLCSYILRYIRGIWIVNFEARSESIWRSYLFLELIKHQMFQKYLLQIVLKYLHNFQWSKSVMNHSVAKYRKHILTFLMTNNNNVSIIFIMLWFVYCMSVPVCFTFQINILYRWNFARYILWFNSPAIILEYHAHGLDTWFSRRDQKHIQSILII